MGRYNILYPKIRKLTFFSSSNRTFVKIKFTFDHKPNLSQ